MPAGSGILTTCSERRPGNDLTPLTVPRTLGRHSTAVGKKVQGQHESHVAAGIAWAKINNRKRCKWS